MADAVLLIPGFFGFGRFGQPPGVVLDYFAGVAPIIKRNFRGEVYAHEPPPTGSLDSRVASLHGAVEKLLAGEPLPHYPKVARADRVHLIGHSTGGLDARLYTRPEYQWNGGPAPASRAPTLAKIGDVVTLSAPFRGTPIAKYAAPERDVFLLGVYWLTVLGSSRKLGGITSRVIAIIAQALLRGTNPSDQLNTLSAALRVASDDPDAAFVEEALAFFKLIVKDRRLLDDLTVESLAERNKRLTGKDHPRIRCFVSVSPEPDSIFSTAGIAELLGGGLTEVAEQALYSHLYADTGRADTPGKVPTLASRGLKLGNLTRHLKVPRASDGVVPIRSQTIDGTAAGIILGDHLDVTGHFEGSQQRNVFKSHADFDKERLTALWTRIALGLGRSDAELKKLL